MLKSQILNQNLVFNQSVNKGLDLVHGNNPELLRHSFLAILSFSLQPVQKTSLVGIVSKQAKKSTDLSYQISHINFTVIGLVPKTAVAHFIAKSFIYRLSEIVQNLLSSALESISAIKDHIIEVLILRIFEVLFGLRVALKKVINLPIPWPVEQNAVAGLPVPPGSAALLVVVLDSLGNRVIYYEANVRLVYSHPKGDCRNHDEHLVVHPVLLILLSLLKG